MVVAHGEGKGKDRNSNISMDGYARIGKMFDGTSMLRAEMQRLNRNVSLVDSVQHREDLGGNSICSMEMQERESRHFDGIQRVGSKQARWQLHDNHKDATIESEVSRWHAVSTFSRMHMIEVDRAWKCDRWIMTVSVPFVSGLSRAHMVMANRTR